MELTESKDGHVKGATERRRHPWTKPRRAASTR